MAWVHIKSTTYTATSGDGYFEVQVHYDDSNDSPTSMKVRFQAYRLKGKDSSFSDNGYYLLVNPGADSEKLYTLKAPGKAWDESIKTEITLSKTYSTSNFTIPAFWICNTGSVTPDTSARTIKYSDYSGSVYGIFKDGGKRQNYVTRVSSVTKSGIVATNGAAPTLNVDDKRNNTVLLSGSVGKNGTNNSIQSVTLYYTTDGTDPKSSSSPRTAVSLATTSSSFSKTINISKACKVRAYIICKFKYNDTSVSKEADVTYYVKPGNAGKPKLSDSSFRNGRLTIKQDWGWEWALATAGNTSSPVDRYRVRFYINDKNTQIIDYYDGVTIRSKLVDGSTTDYAYDRNATASLPMPMRPTMQNIKPGDTVKLSVQAYAKNGAGDILASSIMTSDTYTVQNAGIVNVKVAGAWKEGQVYVKANGSWHEAETVNTKVGGTWKESQ